MKLGCNGKPFIIIFNEPYFKKGDIVNAQYKVLKVYKENIFKKILRYFTGTHPQRYKIKVKLT